MVIKNKSKKTYILIDVAIPVDGNVMQMEVEKKLKNKSLCIKIQWMWYLKLMVMPVIMTATSIVTKGLKKNLEANQENIQQVRHKNM